ncbi:MAG: hypothetical protein OXC44_05895 [Proteobacteria bacterium]|nr:hypothetical protein [Pseudomonadota bacterium]
MIHLLRHPNWHVMSCLIIFVMGLWVKGGRVLSKDLPLIGTPPRTEIEAKYALNASSHLIAIQLTNAVHGLIKDDLKNMSFGKAAGCDLKIDRRPKSFAFLDHYFDTPQDHLYRNAASYRVRMRWSSYHNYLRHTLFAWSSLFPPTRLEIQAKTHYRTATPGDLTELMSEETRLEFRKESSPFNTGFPLPHLAHIDMEDAITWAQTGTYEQHPIYPHYALTQYLHNTLKKPHSHNYTFNKRLSLLNQRHRFHLSCKHPLGSGPNPDQVFIITIDHVHCLKGCCAYKHMIEIEIERERNTSTYLDQFKSYENSQILKDHPVAKRAFDYTQKLRHAYIADHSRLKQQISNMITKNSMKPLTMASKYRRFGCIQKNSVLSPDS